MLAERLARRDGSALAVLYDQYGSAVYSIALRILRSAGDAEEVAQEVFLFAWEKAEQFDPTRGSLIAWLGTKARSRAIDRLRERQSRDRRHEALAQESQFEPPLPAPGPERELSLTESRTLVRRALEQLPREQREALESAYFDGLTQSEIATRTSTPLGTVKTRMRQGLLRLRAAMGSRLAEESLS
jgi:RNA polymerase sigma-70 factor, ECF subfamily